MLWSPPSRCFPPGCLGNVMQRPWSKEQRVGRGLGASSPGGGEIERGLCLFCISLYQRTRAHVHSHTCKKPRSRVQWLFQLRNRVGPSKAHQSLLSPLGNGIHGVMSRLPRYHLAWPGCDLQIPALEPDRLWALAKQRGHRKSSAKWGLMLG